MFLDAPQFLAVLQQMFTQRLIVVSEQVTTRLLTVSAKQLSITHRHSVDDDTASSTHCHTQRLTAGDDTPSDGLREAAVNHTQTQC